MTSTTDRRDFVAALAGLGMAGVSGVAALAAQAGGDVATTAPPRESQPPLEALGRVPWPYRPLEAEPVARQAFLAYPRAGCMLAVFYPLAGGVAERLGPPYTAFPFGMFGYGAAGVVGWGTLCGALNGAAAAFALLSPQPAALIAALFTWYERTALPDLAPAGARFPSVPAVAGSVLCHASIARWCLASGKRSGSPERAERCAALSASVARQAVLLLNGQASGAPAGSSPDPATANCLGCHGAAGTLGNTAGRMPCAPCHTPSELAARGHAKT